jgi:hypothetical protein
MDFVPASDEEDILFPTPVAAPKSSAPEDPYSFEALVGMYTTLGIMFARVINFPQLPHPGGADFRPQSPHAS